jgi:hypothetical protein
MVLLLALLPIMFASTESRSVIQRDILQTPLAQTKSREANKASKLPAVTVEFEMNPGDEGALISWGNESESYILEIRGARVILTYGCFFQDEAIIKVSEKLHPGRSTVRYEFGAEQAGCHPVGSLFANGKLVEHSGASSTAESSQDPLTTGMSYTGTITRVAFSERTAP